MDLLLVLTVGRFTLAIVHIVLLEEAGMEMVVTTGEDATGSCTEDVQWKVVGENFRFVLRLSGIVPCLEGSHANSEGRVEGSVVEVVNRAKSPKDKADSWNTPDAEVDSLGLGTGHVEDEKNEDEGADCFHVEGGDFLRELDIARVDHILGNSGGDEKRNVLGKNSVFTIFLDLEDLTGDQHADDGAANLRENDSDHHDKVLLPLSFADVDAKCDSRVEVAT